jgi:glycosyltransferase involved in cell wall biosynthesis
MGSERQIRSTSVMMTADVVGGVWVFTVGLARALGAAGFRILLVTLGPRPSPAQRAMISGCPNVWLAETDLALEWQDPAGHDLRRARASLRELADRFVPDLVHLNGFREASFDWEVPTIVVAHSCVNSWVRACDEREWFAGDEWKTYTANVRAGLRNANAWAAPTAAFRDELVEQYGLLATGNVIWNGVEDADRPSGPKLPIILGAGRVWDRAKNLASLASAHSGLDWPIRIAGPTENGRRGASIVHGLEWLGEIAHEALLREMDAASIYVSPALYEPFGLSVLEAASAGCALVLSDIPSLRELWDGAALFVAPADTEALTACLCSLCTDDVKRAGLQQAAAARSRRYSLRRTASAYKSLYGSLLDASAGRTAERAEASA